MLHSFQNRQEPASQFVHCPPAVAAVDAVAVAEETSKSVLQGCWSAAVADSELDSAS